MQWKNVKLIYLREMRDQLRDRRTLFLIAVLPLLLYPLLGMSVFQLTQFLQNNASRVLILGSEETADKPWAPKLVEDGRFATALFPLGDQRESLQVVPASAFADLAPASRGPDESDESWHESRLEAARRHLANQDVEAVVVFPPGFGARIGEVREAMKSHDHSTLADIPQPAILFSSARDESKVARARVEDVLERWRGELVAGTLAAGDVPIKAAEPFTLDAQDVAQPQMREAATWSKVLPFIVFIWALTGAFYPAVDLCAGEKERGTLETLLTSPALRREIVWGKLLTIMTFSNATALLNLLSMGITGKFVIDQLNMVTASGGGHALTLPPLAALGWLALALIPISTLFSALCLACAALARSSKEGQYYLMPIMLVSLPLMMLPMAPGVELNLGNSLAPLTGAVLLMRSVIIGQYREALPYVIPVLAVTIGCCLLAIRWAEEQFNRESVLFRESERLELRRWLTHMVRDRGETPSFAQAAFCVAIIFAAQFFASVALSSNAVGSISLGYLAKSVFVSQLACIFAPAAIMTLILTRNPVRTLLLERAPKWQHLAAAAALAVLLHGPAVQLSHLLQWLYPISPAMLAQSKALEEPLANAVNFWQVLLLMAVLPPLCEELAFRGFILSGFRHLGHKWWAIVLSAVAFGGVHVFLQQKASAAVVGVIIGYLAVQTGSLWPGIVYHMLHNGLQLSALRLSSELENAPQDSLTQRLLGGENPLVYQPAVVALVLVAAAGILWMLRGEPPQATSEEQVEEARRQANTLVGAQESPAAPH